MMLKRHIVITLLALLLAPAVRASPTTAPTTQLTVEAPLHAVDLNGHVIDLQSVDRRATGIVFLATECPISRKYIPQLNELAKDHALIGIISDPTLTRAKVKSFA